MASQESKPKRMACWNCPRYDRTTRQCRDGKANPRTKSDTFAVAEVMGLQALCHYNLYRDALALRMYAPEQRPAIPPPRQRRSRRPKVEIVEEEEEAAED